MKKIILCGFYFLFLSLYTLHAQAINKSDRLFGGSFTFSFLNFNSNGINYYNSGNAGFFPSYGWGLKKDLVFGIRGSINYQRIETVNSSAEKNIINAYTFGSGLFLKKYKLLKNRFGIYWNNEVNGNYNINKQRNTVLPGSMKNYSWGVGYNLNPGVFYKFSENFFGEGNIGGLNAAYYSNGSTNDFWVGVTFLQSFNLGINYRIAMNK